MIGHDMIIWTDDLDTGVAKIDEQHRILVNSINDANTRLAANSNAEILDQISRDLLSYALYHFETEEDLMQEFGYAENNPDDLEAHLRQHREFSAKVVEVREGIKAGKLISRDDLLTFLNGWLINHILKSDKRLGAFILTKQK
jgi:hemerythrin-like metal-binding protein